MVAARDLNPLELILKESPAVVGPYSNTLPGCLQCFRKVDGSYACTNCGFPMCNPRCQAYEPSTLRKHCRHPGRGLE